MKNVKLIIGSLIAAFFSPIAFAIINGSPVSAAAETLCNNGAIQDYFIICPSAWSAGALPPNTAPQITLTGSSAVTYTEGDSYTELGASCTDAEDSPDPTVPAPSFTPSLNMSAAGSYVATYTCTDAGGLTDTVTRTVTVNSAGGGSALAFTDVSATAVPSFVSGQSAVVAPFEGDWGYIDDDTCLDYVIMSHGTEDPDGIYLQNNSGSSCLGTFSYSAQTYRADNGNTTRFTSGLIIMDGNNDGDADLFGWDADGGAALQAIQTAADPLAFGFGTGCLDSNDRCLPIDYDNDGDLEVVNALLAGQGFSADVTTAPSISGRVYDWQDDTTHFTPPWASLSEPNLTRAWAMPLIFDANNDSYPDMVYPQLDIIFFGSASGFVSGTEGNFTADTTLFDTAWTTDANEHNNGHQQTFIDYDNDGDLDIFKIRVFKGGNNNIDLADADNDGDGIFLLQNNGSGVFVDVATSELAGITLRSLTYSTTYAGVGAGDFDNDGLTDLRVDYLDGSFTDSCVILKNNGTGSWTKHSFTCYDVLNPPTGGVAGSGGAVKTVYSHGDYDNDGLLDLVSSNAARSATQDTAAVHRNTSTGTGNWLSFFVRGAPSYDGWHSRITVYTAGTNNVLCTREVYQAAQFGTINPHCGVGGASTVDVDLQLPHGGALVQFSNVSVNQTVALYATGTIQTVSRGGSLPPSTVASAVSTTVTLTADSAVTPTATELVTFGLPFAEGEVTNLSELKFSIGGSEVGAYVETGLTYHWSDNSIRSATIQLQNVDMTGGDVTVTIDDTGFSVARLTEQTHSNGWIAAGATRDNRSYPRIFALHDPAYLANSGIVPPFTEAPGTQDAFEDYQVGQLAAWAGGLDYQASSNANWLFDRSSAMFKVYMTTGRVEFLKEAFLAKQFYFQHVKNDGTTPTGAGGDGCWTYGGTSCSDGKYIAPQQAKLALALVGDSSQWDDSLIIEMATQADLGWNQFATRDAHDYETEGFTERAAGLTGLSELVAYEMTGDATILAHLNERIASLKDLQQTVKAWDTANTWTPKNGGFTHNLSVHEGNEAQDTAATGNSNVMGFSTWMSENIADFLWQTYWITGNSDIPEMLRQLANAVDLYGFTTTYSSGTYTRDSAFTGNNRTSACNTEGDDTDLLYLTSNFADDASRAQGDWWASYSDTHNIETVLILATGYYFETDAGIKTRLASRINTMLNGWVNTTCDDLFGGVYRMFNWQHRSNSVRTWDWIEAQ